MAAHQDDRYGGPYQTGFARELRTDEIRHCFVGQYEIVAQRSRLERLQRRAARAEACGFVSEAGEQFLGERHQQGLIIDDHDRLTVPAWQLAVYLGGGFGGFAVNGQPDLEPRALAGTGRHVNCATYIGNDPVHERQA